MRTLYFVFLLVFVAAVGGFVYYNQGDVTVRYLDKKEEVSFPILVGVTYLLGMFTGWAVVGMLRRSYRRVIDDGR